MSGKNNSENLPESAGPGRVWMLGIYLEKDRAIRYLYDANGNKLRKIVFGEQGHIEYIRDYSGSFVYTDGAIDFILTEEGRVNNKPEGFIYEYFLKDHLGNTRVSFEADDGTINTTAETHYYPFGMTLHGLNQPLRHHRDPVKSQYLYNGKELQSDNGLEWYDYGARFYDAQLGRWTTPDPLAAEAPGWTPYRFGFCSPINFTDPEGLFEDWFQNELRGDVYYNSEMRKGDESKLGEGWIYMGKNEMFSDGTPSSTDAAIMGLNDKLSSGSSFEMENGIVKLEASFDGENAETFMENLDFRKVTTQATQEIETGVIKGAIGTRREVKVTRQRLVYESVEKVGYIPNHFERLGSYRLKTIKPGEPIIEVGFSSETVQYRFSYGKKPSSLKLLDALIFISNIQSGNIKTSK